MLIAVIVSVSDEAEVTRFVPFVTLMCSLVRFTTDSGAKVKPE